MPTITAALASWLDDRDGQGLAEYALILALVASSRSSRFCSSASRSRDPVRRLESI